MVAAGGEEKGSDSSNFWKLSSSNQDVYWRAYLSTRPAYSKSFYSLIYDYHASHSASPCFSIAHDVGTGPGQVAAVLASRFSHVVLSDNNDSHLDYARQSLLSSSFHKSQFTFTLSTGEDLTSKFPHSSADLIACAEMFPLMDTLSALRSFHSLLKPGSGTLAVWFYGRPHFAEPAYSDVCQPLLDGILNHHFSRVIKGSGPAARASWKRAADGMASWLDYIAFSEDDREHVERRKWNAGWTQMGFFGKEACDFEVEPESNVRDGEMVNETEDKDFWRNDWGAEELKRFVEFSFPFKEAHQEGVKSCGQSWRRGWVGRGHVDRFHGRLY